MDTIDFINNQIMFNNKNIITFIDKENIPWFKAKDVCDVLEYENTRGTIQRHIREKYKKMFKDIESTETVLLHPDTIFINEPGLYALIVKSKVKLAEKFQDWVCEQVLPSIRKQGEYKLQKELAIEFDKKLKIG